MELVLGVRAFGRAAGTSRPGRFVFGGCQTDQRNVQDGLYANAALGRARRLGIAVAERPKAVFPGNSAPPRMVQEPPAVEMQQARPEAPAAPLDQVAIPELRCVEVEPRRLSLIELERGDCRYPYSGDEEGEAITFCGHPRRPGSSYCSPHFHLSRNPVEPEESDVSATWHRIIEAA